MLLTVTHIKNVWALAWWVIDWNGEMLSEQWCIRLDYNPLSGTSR